MSGGRFRPCRARTRTRKTDKIQPKKRKKGRVRNTAPTKTQTDICRPDNGGRRRVSLLAPRRGGFAKPARRGIFPGAALFLSPSCPERHTEVLCAAARRKRLSRLIPHPGTFAPVRSFAFSQYSIFTIIPYFFRLVKQKAVVSFRILSEIVSGLSGEQPLSRRDRKHFEPRAAHDLLELFVGKIA